MAKANDMLFGGNERPDTIQRVSTSTDAGRVSNTIRSSTLFLLNLEEGMLVTLVTNFVMIHDTTLLVNNNNNRIQTKPTTHVWKKIV